MASYNQELPADIVFEILSRTTLQTLDRCKAVCKTWKHVIEEPNFMPVYCQRTNNVSGFVMQTMIQNEYFSTFVSLQSKEEGDLGKNKEWPCDGTKILASSEQGICCCERQKRRNRRYYACKPTTQQWKPLPNPKLRYTTAGVAIVVLRSSPLRYKIVRLSYLPTNQYLCEVFDSDIWAWRAIQDPLNVPYDEFIFESNPAVSVGCSVYWRTTKDSVLGFDVIEERFMGRLWLPDDKTDAYISKHLIKYEGKLGLTRVMSKNENENLELWVLNGLNRWVKKLIVNAQVFGKDCYLNHVVFYNSRIAFAWKFYEASFSKLQDSSFSTTIEEVELESGYVHEVFRFRSDFEAVNL